MRERPSRWPWALNGLTRKIASPPMSGRVFTPKWQWFGAPQGSNSGRRRALNWWRLISVMLDIAAVVLRVGYCGCCCVVGEFGGGKAVSSFERGLIVRVRD